MIKKSRRIALAMAAGAAVASVAASVLLFVAIGALNGESIGGSIEASLRVVPLAFLMCLLTSETIGLVWHAIAVRLGWHAAVHYWAPGAACGIGMGIGTFWLLASTLGVADSDAWSVLFWLAAYGAVLGGLTGCFAWLIRRPDRDAPANPASTPP